MQQYFALYRLGSEVAIPARRAIERAAWQLDDSTAVRSCNLGCPISASLVDHYDRVVRIRLGVNRSKQSLDVSLSIQRRYHNADGVRNSHRVGLDRMASARRAGGHWCGRFANRWRKQANTRPAPMSDASGIELRE